MLGQQPPRRRSPLLVVAGVVLLLVVLWVVVIPAAQGFHIGYNAATDHQCLTRIFQWCK